MKANDYHLWREIPNSPTRLLQRHLSGTAALEEIEKTHPYWFRDYVEAPAEQGDKLMFARIGSFLERETNPFVSFISNCEEGFSLDQIKYNGTLEGLREANAFSEKLAQICLKSQLGADQ